MSIKHIDTLAELIDNALESMEINGMHTDYAYKALKDVMIYDGAKAPRIAHLPSSAGYVVICDQSTPRGKAGHNAAVNAMAALFDAHAVGGSARERSADEACRYFVHHFVEPAAVATNVGEWE